MKTQLMRVKWFHSDQLSSDVGSLVKQTLIQINFLHAGPFTSALANRYGFRTVTITGAVLASTGFFVSSWINDIQLLYVTYGIIGGERQPKE